MSDIPTGATHRVEWRVCGYRANHGGWESQWTSTDPQGSPNARWELKLTTKRNEKVWIERRDVWETVPERIEVKP